MVFLFFIAYGGAPGGFWRPIHIIVALLLSAILPLPNILLAILFKSKRNIQSIANIARQWHRAFSIGFGALAILGYLSGALLHRGIQ